MKIDRQQPSKQAVRDFLSGRVKSKTPPPDIEEIRRQLGWPLMGKIPDCQR
jgi:hypothetical protein